MLFRSIYFGSGDFNVYALTDGGQGTVTEKWAFLTGGSIETSSPAIGADGTIYIGSDPFLGGLLFAVNPDGTQKWAFPTNGRLGASSPTIGADGTIYVAAQSGKLYAVGIPTSLTSGTLAVAPSLMLAFGRVSTGSSKTRILTIKNISNKGTLSFSVGTLLAPFSFTAGPSSIPIPPGQKQTLTVEFSPTLSPGRASATLLITSNDPKHPQVKVKLTGMGVAGKL